MTSARIEVHGAVPMADSVPASPAAAQVPPDLATCAECLRELCDPAGRRYGYAFLNRTDCRPRATIIEGLPYDRARTVMRVPAVPGVRGPSITIPAIGGFVPSRSPARSAGRDSPGSQQGPGPYSPRRRSARDTRRSLLAESWRSRESVVISWCVTRPMRRRLPGYARRTSAVQAAGRHDHGPA